MKTENKSLKTLKGQLFGAVSMMLVAAIALGTSTYAWFINNRTVEVEKMQLSVSTSTSLLVKLQQQSGVGNWTGPKSVIINQDIIGTGAQEGGWTKFLSTKMIPASTTDNALKTAPKFFVTDNHVTDGKLDQFLEVDSTHGAENAVGQGSVKRLGLTFLASNKTDVYLGAKDLSTLADMITAGTGTLPTGVTADWATQATAIKRALRVAIVPAVGDPTVLQFDDGAVIASNGNNTDYNSNKGTLSDDETKGEYAGIAAAGTTTTAGKITEAGKLTAYTPVAADKALKARFDIPNPGDISAPADATKKALFTVPAGETGIVVNVYIWLEGTDKDCLNELSSYGFNLRLPFTGVPITTP